MQEKDIDDAWVRSRIRHVRGKAVMLDRDLAKLYDVETKVLNRAVRRNIERFPEDFMIVLTEQEWSILRCQIGTSSSWGGHGRFLPIAFTEQGVAMLSSVLRSKRAVQVNIEIVRAFVEMRRTKVVHQGLARRMELIEYRLQGFGEEIQNIFRLIRDMIEEAEDPPKEIGFKPKEN